VFNLQKKLVNIVLLILVFGGILREEAASIPMKQLCKQTETRPYPQTLQVEIPMKNMLRMLTLIGLLPMANASLLYSLDMSSDNTDDFNQRVQMGRLGGDNFASLNFVHDTDRYLLQGRYGAGVGLSLNQGGTSGVYTGDTEVSMTFTYTGNTTVNGDPVSADPSNTLVGLSLRGLKGGDASNTFTTNNYPIYYAHIQQGVFSMVKKWGFNDTTEQSTLASYTLQAGEISNSDTYRFSFGTFDDGANVNIIANLYQNNSLISSLSYLDDGSVGGGPFTSGYVGLLVLQSGINTNDFMGIEMTSFAVAIPEPSTLVLLGMAGLASVMVLRKRR